MKCLRYSDGVHRAFEYSIAKRSEVCVCGCMTFMTDKRKHEGWPFKSLQSVIQLSLIENLYLALVRTTLFMSTWRAV